jgi:hypothetical protein
VLSSPLGRERAAAADTASITLGPSLFATGLRWRFGSEDLAQPFNVRELRLSGAHLLSETRHELCAKNVDAPVQDTTAVGDLVLLLLELANERSKIVVSKGRQVGK